MLAILVAFGAVSIVLPSLSVGRDAEVRDRGCGAYGRAGDKPQRGSGARPSRRNKRTRPAPTGRRSGWPR